MLARISTLKNIKVDIEVKPRDQGKQIKFNIISFWRIQIIYIYIYILTWTACISMNNCDAVI